MLTMLIALVTVIPLIYELLVPEEYNLEEERIALQQLMQREAGRDTLYPKDPERGRSAIKKLKLFDFDPNHSSLPIWQSLGLSLKQAQVMVRYTDKGGRFRKKEDLQKMYVISPQLYAQLAPYIYIDDSTAFKDNPAKHEFSKFSYPAKPMFKIISLNTADTLLLDQVKGIGPAFARRIYRYRIRLGGFYRKEQLLEVYGLDSAKYFEIKDQVSIDDQQIIRFKINSIEYIDLKDHPYLNAKQINAILQFRKQHGNYVNIADLKKVAILSAETIDKLAPYISFEHD